jgi:uncharacterized membrane protein YhiD involved in acid resistance
MNEQLMDLLASNTGVLTFQGILTNFFISAVIGCVIFISYRISHSGVSYSARFNVSLVMLTLITTLVMNVIGNNIALSLGMVGALSIVRFRTAIKDPRDTAYIFWCIAIGICCGVSEYMIAAIGTAVIFGMMLIFSVVRKNERYLLVLRAGFDQSEELEKLVSLAFDGKASLKVHNSTEQTVEFIFEISQQVLEKAKKHGDLHQYFRENAKVTSVSLVNQSDEINR